ncbi:MAG: hypothetical protein K6B68_14490 [Eubacterium sp.]|nr:hypothetical protein [Eubacterium sp.]
MNEIAEYILKTLSGMDPDEEFFISIPIVERRTDGKEIQPEPGIDKDGT